MRWILNRRDLLFLIDTFMLGRASAPDTLDLLRHDYDLIDSMLDDQRLFERLMNEEDVLVHVSPRLFFTVLLRQARRDMAQERFTVEERSRQKVLLFDTNQVSELLEQTPVLDYLAHMLASFTRVESVTVPVQVREGVWRRYRTNNMDVEGLIRYSQTLEQEFQFEPYQRIADVCLFLTGMFPEYIETQHRYPASRQIRPQARGRICTSREDYEKHGGIFYRLAAEHQRARMQGLNGVLTTLSQNFILAEKPLSFLAQHYLQFTRQHLFDI